MTSINTSTNQDKSQGQCEPSSSLRMGLKVALVHDFLIQYGGAERVLETLSEMFPEAPVYTLLYDKEVMKGKFSDRKIRTSFLQKFPKFLRNRKRYLLPFMPVAPETFDLREFDLVISSSGAWSKGLITRLDTMHVSYIHSPMRFIWDYNEKYLKSIGKKAGVFKRLFLNYLRVWDFQASNRPDFLIANSKYTQERIRKYYKRKSALVHPGINTGSNIKAIKMKSFKEKKYFLVVSRLAPYKKVDLVVETFNKLGLPLIIIGEGEQEKYLRKIAKKNIKILGWQDDEKIEKYYAGARAFIFPAVDDFGMTTVEAMSFGIPVIAIKKGGAREIVEEGVTGEFFDAQKTEVLADGVRRFINKENTYNKDVIIASAKRFSKNKFKEGIENAINKVC